MDYASKKRESLLDHEGYKEDSPKIDGPPVEQGDVYHRG
jgi:hypothetical protein